MRIEREILCANSDRRRCETSWSLASLAL